MSRRIIHVDETAVRAARITVRLSRRYYWRLDPLVVQLARTRLPADKWWRRWR